MDTSQGGAFAHNLFGGDIQQEPETTRVTPFHEAHSTRIAGRTHIDGGDNWFYNNIFVGPTGLDPYDDVERPVRTGGNVFLDGATPMEEAPNPIVDDAAAGLELLRKSGALHLRFRGDPAWKQERQRTLVTTEVLGRAEVTDLPYEQPDGRTLRIDADYLGQRRDPSNPLPGPFSQPLLEEGIVMVWPK